MIWNQLAHSGFVLFLGAAAWIDARKRALPFWLLAGGVAAAAATQLFLQEVSLLEMLTGLIPGAGLLLCAWATSQKIGYGDGALFLSCGVFLGFLGSIILLFLSLVLAALTAVILLILKKRKRKDGVPFAPFLLAGYTAMLAFY